VWLPWILQSPKKTLRSFLEQYGKPNFMTDAILQEACTQACIELFGTPSTNVKYAEAVMNEMKAQGHIVRMKFTTRRETLKNIKRVVISEELLHKNISTIVYSTPMNKRSFGTTGRKSTES
jgi:nitrogenase molybdenum-iron protein alpha/beta subunit